MFFSPPKATKLPESSIEIFNQSDWKICSIFSIPISILVSDVESLFFSLVLVSFFAFFGVPATNPANCLRGALGFVLTFLGKGSWSIPSISSARIRCLKPSVDRLSQVAHYISFYTCLLIDIGEISGRIEAVECWATIIPVDVASRGWQ